MYYVYVWKTADATPFYVGKGSKGRAYDRSPSHRCADWFKVYDQGGCFVEIVDEFIIEADAFLYEMALIEEFGRREFGGLLVNRTDGGDGPYGVFMTDETRAKISNSQRGRKQSEESIQKRRETMLKKQTDPEYWAARKRLGDATRGVPRTDKVRASISAANLGKIRSQQTRDKISNIQRGRIQTDRHRENSTAARRLAPPRADNTSGFKGVSIDKSTGKWVAYVNHEGSRRRLGQFQDIETAARAYDSAALALWGFGNCYLNFAKEAAIGLAG